MSCNVYFVFGNACFFVLMPQNCYLAFFGEDRLATLPSPDLCTPLATTDQDAVISCLIAGASKYFFFNRRTKIGGLSELKRSGEKNKCRALKKNKNRRDCSGLNNRPTGIYPNILKHQAKPFRILLLFKRSNVKRRM